MRKITYNGGYYIVKTAMREVGYRADILHNLEGEYQIRIALAERALEDLKAIAQHIKERT